MSMCLKLTTCRALILYNTYIVVLVCVNTDVNSVLEVDQQQLALYAHFSQTMIILTLLSDNVLFIQNCITLQQMRTHQLLYINAILIQSQRCWFLTVVLTVRNVIWHFLKCCCMSKHFSECCSNCKWCDHAAHCFICNNNVLIVISDNENNDSADEMSALLDQDRLHWSYHWQRQLLLILTFRYIWLLFLFLHCL
jgi:hypothetical protein